MSPPLPSHKILIIHLPTTDREVPPNPSPSTGSKIFVENVHLVSFWAFSKPCLRVISYVGNVVNLKKVMVCISKEKLL